MTTTFDLDEFLRTLTYKEGWTFTCNAARQIEAVYHGPNVLNEATVTISLPLLTPYDWDWSEQDTIDAILFLIARIEDHERIEWIKIDGEQYFDAHVNGVNDFHEGARLLTEHRIRVARRFGIPTSEITLQEKVSVS